MAKRILWGLAVVLLLLAPFGAEQLSRPHVIHEPDLVYSMPDRSLYLDLARPAQGSGPFPAVLCIHGGGWVSGDRSQMKQTIEVLARRGYVAAALDYRLAPKHRFPAALEDCQAAVRWLRAQAGKYRIDPNRIGVVGIAAGGHLACLVGLTGQAEPASKVQAVVSFFGPTDLNSGDWGPEAREKNIVPFLGGTQADNPDAYRKASPVEYPCTAAPPFLFVHGQADTVVPLKQSETLARKIREAGGSAQVIPIEGEGHGFRDLPSLLRSIEQMLTFLDRTLKK